MKCIKCGNNTYHFTGDVVKQLEKIINQAKKRMEQISVVDFSTVLTAA